MTLLIMFEAMFWRERLSPCGTQATALSDAYHLVKEETSDRPLHPNTPTEPSSPLPPPPMEQEGRTR